jgi:diacylglycerol kinase family enzyme
MRYGIFFNPNAGDGDAEESAKKCVRSLKKRGTRQTF